MAMTSVAIGINNGLAIVSGLFLVALPIFLAVSLIKKWKRVPSKELVEGGEKTDISLTRLSNKSLSLNDIDGG